MEPEQNNPQLAAVHAILEKQVTAMDQHDNSEAISSYNTAIANWKQQELQSPGANPKPDPPMLRHGVVTNFWPFTVTYNFAQYNPPPDPALAPDASQPANPIGETIGDFQGSLGPIVPWYLAAPGDQLPAGYIYSDATGSYKKWIFVRPTPFGLTHYPRWERFAIPSQRTA